MFFVILTNKTVKVGLKKSLNEIRSTKKFCKIIFARTGSNKLTEGASKRP